MVLEALLVGALAPSQDHEDAEATGGGWRVLGPGGTGHQARAGSDPPV